MKHADQTKAADTARQRIAEHDSWYHQIELAPGVVTPGTHQSADELATLDRLGLPAECHGVRVLDIGCRDGYFAFEMERRGATVVGLDYASPDVTGFSIAAGLLDSSVEYRVDNVYSITPERYGLFDLILFLGVIYHLRNPMLAIDRVRSVQRAGGVLFLETQLATDEQTYRSDTPLWQFYPGSTLHGDGSNKWAPNPAGLRRLIEECEYDIVTEHWTSDRGYIVGQACNNEPVRFFRELDGGVDIWGR